MSRYIVEYYVPKLGEKHVVVTTAHGVSLSEAQQVAAASNRQFKPLQYTVKEAK